LGRITQVSNPLGAFSVGYLNATGKVQTVSYPNQTISTFSYYPVAQDERLSGIQISNGSGSIRTYGFSFECRRPDFELGD
jgi:hypothetical protein